MYKKFFKPALVVALSLAMTAGTFTGCSSTKPAVSSTNSASVFTDKDPSSYNGSIIVWSFTDELKSSKFIDAFNKVYPNIKVTLVVSTTDNNEYQTKLATAMSANAGAPDVFLSEDTFVKEEINSPYADNLSAAPYNAESLVKGNMATYAVALGRDSSNELKALTWQATAGGIFYRRSLAKQYFGTDDPDKISTMMNSFDNIISMGQTLNQKSGGKVKMLSTYKDLFVIANGSKASPWVVNDKLTIDPTLTSFIDTAKKVRDAGADANADSWSAPWSASMTNDTVFAYVLPTWGEGIIKS
jgi:hypothetical protein